MTSQKAYYVWASERGVSQEIDAANWKAYQEALKAEAEAAKPAKKAKQED